MKKIVSLYDEINEEKFCECIIIMLDEKHEFVVVGEKRIDKILEVLFEILNYDGGHEIEITYDCYIEKSKLNQPGVYSSLKKFFEDFPDILDEYFTAVEAKNTNNKVFEFSFE